MRIPLPGMPRRSLILTVIFLSAVAVVAGVVVLSGDDEAVPRSILAIDTAAEETSAESLELGPSSQDPDASEATSSPDALPGSQQPTDTIPPASVPAGDGNVTVGGLSDGCLTGGDHAPTGEPIVVPGTSDPSGGGTVTRYIVEVEGGLAVDATCFASVVDSILADERSWGGGGRLSLQRVDDGPVDFRVSLFSPALTDSQCAPLQTNGIYSCWTGTRAAINAWRWQHGTNEYTNALEVYREYLINHEVGHGLGHNHTGCPGEGETAPVMQQQTKTLDGCTMNGYPLETER